MDEDRPPSDRRAAALEHLVLAGTYREQNELEKALFECERATGLDPAWADAHYLRGLLLESLGRNEEAQEAFRRAAHLDPSYRESSSDVGPALEHMSAEQTSPDLQWVPWTARDAWWGLVMAVGLSFVIPLIFVVPAVLFEVSSEDIDSLLTILIPLGSLLLVVPVWWFSLRKYGVGWPSLGFRSFTGSTLGIGCGMLIGFYVVSAIYGAIISLFEQEVQPSLVPLSEELSIPWILPLTAIFLAPIFEEVFFRGFLFAGFRQRYGWMKAALISSAIFALIHLQPVAIPPLFLLGFVLAYLYHRSDSIWPSILMHGIVNLFGVIGQFLITTN